MTNTYSDDAPTEEKIKEELRCIRMAMERLMRILDEGMFVDYEMEKFGSKRKRNRGGGGPRKDDKDLPLK